ncbi:hypothetical protein FRC09_001349 [Ceratobasidium sp. 395]|nr:hypothetical protein FRC09_001349 [Ceratobasidium sp. 395]
MPPQPTGAYNSIPRASPIFLAQGAFFMCDCSARPSIRPAYHRSSPSNSAFGLPTPARSSSRIRLTQRITPPAFNPPGMWLDETPRDQRATCLGSLRPSKSFASDFPDLLQQTLNAFFRPPDPVSPYRSAVLLGITSEANSDDEGDIPSSALLAPIGVLNDLASVAAQSGVGGRHGLKRKRGDGPSPTGRSFRRASSISSHRSLAFPAHTSPPRQPESTNASATYDIPPIHPGVSIQPEPDQEPEAVEEEHAPERERDAIENGIVSESEAGSCIAYTLRDVIACWYLFSFLLW